MEEFQEVHFPFLKESWTGERDIAAYGKTMKNYLSEIKSKEETAADFAEQHAKN